MISNVTHLHDANASSASEPESMDSAVENKPFTEPVWGRQTGENSEKTVAHEGTGYQFFQCTLHHQMQG